MNLNRPLIKALPVNSNAAAFAAKTACTTGDTPLGNNPTAAAIAAVGLVRLAAEGGAGGYVPSNARLYPYGLGAAANTFSVRLWGWWHIGAGPDLAKLWMPGILGEFACTLSTFAGVAGAPVINTELFCDIISIVALREYTLAADIVRFGSDYLLSPANNTPGCVQVPLRGAAWIEWDFDQTAGTPTMNVLYQLFDEVSK